MLAMLAGEEEEEGEEKMLLVLTWAIVKVRLRLGDK